MMKGGKLKLVPQDNGTALYLQGNLSFSVLINMYFQVCSMNDPCGDGTKYQLLNMNTVRFAKVIDLWEGSEAEVHN